MIEKNKKPLFFRIIRKIVKILYRKCTIEIDNKINGDGNLYISNHAQLHGPLSLYLYFPFKKKIWVIGEMCNRKEAAAYAMEDFWRHKSKATKWIYKIFSNVIVAPLAAYLFKHADTIPVYKDSRLRQTFHKTIKALDEGTDVIIFPEGRDEYNKFINDFQIYFVDVAKHYYRRTNKRLKFYPVYTCPALKKNILGEPITFNPNEKLEVERLRIIKYLQNEITRLGSSLSNHKIVPYTNMNKKYYPNSKS